MSLLSITQLATTMEDCLAWAEGWSSSQNAVPAGPPISRDMWSSHNRQLLGKLKLQLEEVLILKNGMEVDSMLLDIAKKMTVDLRDHLSATSINRLPGKVPGRTWQPSRTNYSTGYRSNSYQKNTSQSTVGTLKRSGHSKSYTKRVENGSWKSTSTGEQPAQGKRVKLGANTECPSTPCPSPTTKVIGSTGTTEKTQS